MTHFHKRAGANAITGSLLTPMFHSTIKPVRNGLYQTEFDSARSPGAVVVGYSHWNGTRWSVQRAHKQDALESESNTALRQDKRWRGLAGQPR